MALRESEMIQLVSFILESCQRMESPLLVREFLRKASDFFQHVPLYPGIIRASLSKVIERAFTVDSIRVGLRIAAFRDGRMMTGTVQQLSDEQVILTDVQILEPCASMTISAKDVVALVKEDVLEQDWPSLMFTEEVGS